MRRRLQISLAILVLAAMATLPVAAQEWAGRGRLQGIVTDDQGVPVEGASVKLNWVNAQDPDQAGPPADSKNGLTCSLSASRDVSIKSIIGMG